MKTTIIFIATIGFAVFCFHVLFDLFCAYHKRRCPKCGKTTKYVGKIYKKENDLYFYQFHCPHCGAKEETTFIEMLRNIE